MDRFLLGVIALLLAATLALQVEERFQRSFRARQIATLEEARVKVFTDYVDALGSAETKSVWHQIYHAANAQLRMQNVLAQETQVLLLTGPLLPKARE